jgi:hypothetical protein
MVWFSHLVAHRSIHSQKFVKCKYCKFESRSESKLMEHEARHTGDKPFICKHDGCDYAGVCKGDLSKNIITTITWKFSFYRSSSFSQFQVYTSFLHFLYFFPHHLSYWYLFKSFGRFLINLS